MQWNETETKLFQVNKRKPEQTVIGPELEANIRSEPYPAYAEDAWRSCEVFFQQSAKGNVEMGLVKDLYACLLA